MARHLLLALLLTVAGCGWADQSASIPQTRGASTARALPPILTFCPPPAPKPTGTPGFLRVTVPPPAIATPGPKGSDC